MECHCGCFGTSQPALCFYFKAPPRRGRNELPAKRAVRVQESLPWRESFMCSSHFIRRVRSYFVPRMGLKLAVREEPCWGSRWSPPLRPGGFIEVHLQTFGLSFGFMLLIEHLSPAAAQNSLLMSFFNIPSAGFCR